MTKYSYLWIFTWDLAAWIPITHCCLPLLLPVVENVKMNWSTIQAVKRKTGFALRRMNWLMVSMVKHPKQPKNAIHPGFET